MSEEPDLYPPNACTWCYNKSAVEGKDMCASCQAYWDRIEAERAAYLARYPNYCHTCGGYGLLYDPGVYRYPDGSGEPPSEDICDDCLGKGKCPRCSQGTMPEEVFNTLNEPTCSACGWTEQSSGYPEG